MNIKLSPVNHVESPPCEAFYHALFELSNDGILLLQDDNFVFCNNQATRILRMSREQILGLKPWESALIQQSSDCASESRFREHMGKAREGMREIFYCERMTSDGMNFTLEVSLASAPELPKNYLVCHVRDVSERLRLQTLEESIIRGTSSAVGKTFLFELLESLATSLDMTYAFVAKHNASFTRAETVAFWNKGEKGENFSYDLAGTPCDNVVNKSLCCYPSGIQELFPEDLALAEMNADSYVGVPISDSNGRPLGIIVLLGNKPMHDQEVVSSVLMLFAGRAGAELERILASEKQKLILHQSIEAVAQTIERRDPYTAGHQRNVAELATAIGKELGLDEERLEGLRLGGLIHDIGKIYVPAEILNRPGKLTDSEFIIVKTHAEVGYEIMRDVEFPWPIAQIIWQHHERLDGSGYPLGLKGDEISLEARIVSVADVVEAISSHRPYRPGLGLGAAIEELKTQRGKLYDPAVVDACIKVLDEGEFTFD